MLRTLLLILSAILIVIGFGPLVVQAQTKGPVTIESAYAFATAESAKTGAVFMTLKNTDAENDVLIKAASNVSEITEMHENFVDMENGRMMMREIPVITVPAHDKAVLEPQGRHIMLIKLKEQLKEGGAFSLTLTFEKAGELVVPVAIVAPGAAPKTAEPDAAVPADAEIPADDPHAGHH